MKDKAVITFAGIAALLVAASGVHRAMSFEPVAAAKHGRLEAVVACESKLEGTLRDPGSVRYDRSLTQYVYENDLHKVTLVYNAKNGFGGYAGQNIYTCSFK